MDASQVDNSKIRELVKTMMDFGEIPCESVELGRSLADRMMDAAIGAGATAFLHTKGRTNDGLTALVQFVEQARTDESDRFNNLDERLANWGMSVETVVGVVSQYLGSSLGSSDGAVGTSPAATYIWGQLGGLIFALRCVIDDWHAEKEAFLKTHGQI